jgi:hypothetical protein
MAYPISSTGESSGKEAKYLLAYLLASAVVAR